MKLSEISYPVYLLSHTNPPNTIDNVVFYTSERHTEDEEGGIVTDTKLRVVDDKSLPGASLATRRLQLKAMGVPLYPLRKGIFFLGDLIKLASPKTMFIDSTGKVFNYTKNTRAKLVCMPITKLYPLPAGGSIVEVKGVHRFKTLHSVDESKKYAGVLGFGGSLVLYGLYEEEFKNTWRLV